MVAAFLLASQVLHADNKPIISPDGSKMVPVKMGNKTTYIKVQEPPDLSKHASWSTSEKYNPTTFDLGRTSTLANKQFDSSDSSVTKSNSSFQQKAFLTKSYSIDSESQANAVRNLNTKVSTDTAAAYGNTASGFDKNFSTSNSNLDQNKKVLFASNTSEYQSRTATIGAQQISPPSASPLAGQSYQGPEIASTRHDLDQVNGGLSRMSDLPNRALTIDEVRDLINHGVKPNTNSKPEPASKPLNDPDYKPIPSPAPPAADEDKNDLIPSPGMTAASLQPPENSEPLPK